MLLFVCCTERLLEDHDCLVDSVMILLRYHNYIVNVVDCVLYRAPAGGPRLPGGECSAVDTGLKEQSAV